MADWNNPDPFQVQALHEALLSAYPSQSSLNTFLFLNFGKTYAQLAPDGQNYVNGLTGLLIQVLADGWLARLVQKAMQDKPQSPKLRVLDRSLGISSVEVPESLGGSLEHIVRQNGGFNDLIPWIDKLAALGQRTCRIEYPLNVACGTGWLVGPDLILTNWHVIDGALPGGNQEAKDYVCRFDYAVTAAGAQPGLEVHFAQQWCVDSSPPSSAELGTGRDAPAADTLDYALIRLATSVGTGNVPAGGKRGWMTLKDVKTLPAKGDIVFAIQHPEGWPVKIAVGDVLDISSDQLRIFHKVDTSGGSSGSMLVNASLEPVGLHHAGDIKYARGKLGQPERNQAVPLARIVQRLQARGNWLQ